MKPKLLSLLALLALGAVSPVPPLPEVPANHEMGFILTEFAPAIHQGKDDCPEGLAGILSENYLNTLAPSERARMSLPVNEASLKSSWQAWSIGSDGANVCSNPEKFPARAVQRELRGKVAPGLDLDRNQPSCGHAEFIGTDGSVGVDNQAYRGMGCTRNYRGVDGTAGDIVKGSNMFLATGEQSIVLLLRGVDSLVKDDAVEVILASTDDRPILDSRQNFLTGASYTVGKNAIHRNILQGRIEAGVLTTDAASLRLRRIFGHGGKTGEKAEWELSSAQLELRIQPDGTIEGLLGAYQTPRNLMISTIAGGLGAAIVAGIDCAAQYNTLMKLADGGRDPKTGQCTSVSMALDVAAVPAFVFDRAPPAKVSRR